MRQAVPTPSSPDSRPRLEPADPTRSVTLVPSVERAGDLLGGAAADRLALGADRMALGPAGGPHSARLGRLGPTCAAVRQLVRDRGGDASVVGHRLLTDRATRRGWRAAGTVSANGSCHMLRTTDGWIALNLARPDDAHSMAAWLQDDTAAAPAGFVGPSDPLRSDAWRAHALPVVASLVRSRPTAMLLERGRLLGLAVTDLGLGADDQLARRGQLATPAPFLAATGGRRIGRRAPPRVLDLSALWAGPLCARILQSAGMDVTRVESPRRRDGFIHGDPLLYRALNGGKRLRLLDPSEPGERAAIIAAIAESDVVVSAARPRVFAQWGVDVDRFVHDGGIWTAITGYGWYGPETNWVAFGDDAAVAGGLYRKATASGSPGFVGDAAADPIAGVTAAWATLLALESDRGALLDIAMREAVAWHANDASGQAHS